MAQFSAASPKRDKGRKDGLVAAATILAGMTLSGLAVAGIVGPGEATAVATIAASTATVYALVRRRDAVGKQDGPTELNS
ncbi:hypothetical protein [Streptomyces sp. NPDC059957]|uniref:hypothetical protein n=1 Tax=unclassified Streptomyces TaxID=2593676 RepID=UPI00366A1EF1